MKLVVRLPSVLLMGAWLASLVGCQKPAPAVPAGGGAAAAPTLDRVVLGKPARKTLTLATTQPGRIEAFEETPLFAKVAGYVDNVLVDIGDPVKKDQPLVKLSVPEMQDDLKQKEALVAQAEAELKQAEAATAGARAAVKSSEARVAQVEAGITRAEADYKRWEAEHARIKELAENRAVTDKLVDETLNQFRAADGARNEAKAAVQSAQALLEESQTGVAKAEADRVAAAARLDVAKANLARTTTLLDYTTIKAPYDGVVTRRQIDTGHFVSPPSAASQPLLVVCRTDVVRIFIDVPELEAEWVNVGDPAVIRVQALGGRTFDAQVTRLAWSLDPANRSLRTEIDVENKGGLLRPGMFAAAVIRLEERPDVLTLPATAIVREGVEAYYCVVADGKIARRKVELGLRSGPDVELRSGPAADEAVVVSPVAALKPDQAVEVVTAEKK
jgi:RND family efflux transporter MFP subunit